MILSTGGGQVVVIAAFQLEGCVSESSHRRPTFPIWQQSADCDPIPENDACRRFND